MCVLCCHRDKLNLIQQALHLTVAKLAGCNKRVHLQNRVQPCEALDVQPACAAACAQEYPPLPKQAPWPSEPQPPAVDWDALIAEVVERGKEVPEVDWAIPGEDAAEEVRHYPSWVTKK